MTAGAGRLTATDAVAQRLQGRRFDLRGYLFEGALLIALLIPLAALFVLLFTVFTTGASVYSERGLEFLTSQLSSNPEQAGVMQGIFGSLLLMVFVVVLAFPIGIGAAIYLEEYAPNNRVTRFINTNVRNLAGVPAIVFGLLGLAIFVVALGPFTGGNSVIAGGLTLAVLVLPIIIITTAEALRAVPNAIREAGFGVGATRWEVIRSHVLPYAAPGILTGTVLSLARALGETAPLIVVGAVVGTFSRRADNMIDQLQGPYTALPTIVYTWARQPSPDFREGLTAAAIIALLVVVLLVNATAIILRNRYDRRW